MRGINKYILAISDYSRFFAKHKKGQNNVFIGLLPRSGQPPLSFDAHPQPGADNNNSILQRKPVGVKALEKSRLKFWLIRLPYSAGVLVSQ